jgi:DNA-binding transcriptional LysR family regulator
MPLPRPSLNALHTFEAVARLRSMTLAAAELCVTHGAVSRQIKALEETLGLALLRRTAHASEPTAEGLRLAEGLGAAFGLIDASLEQLQPGPLTPASATAALRRHGPGS